MIRRGGILAALVCMAALCGCGTYNVKAYDLSGKMIYEGTVYDSWFSGFTNEEGKRVRFYNSTVVLVER